MPTRTISLLPEYEFINRIGRGAGATISLAMSSADKQQVAVKHIVRRGPGDDKFIAQAENEYEIAHRLDHPYLRKCYDLVRIRKWLKTQHLFLIMEYVNGVKLEDRRPKDLLEAVTVYKKIAEGLDAVHASGFVHADIKPNNILLTNAGGVKIIDFGQSCPLGHVKDRVQGTPDYIAPEQVLRREITPRTDVFNLGATMYWIVTGKYFVTMIQNQMAPTGTKRMDIEARRNNEAPHLLDDSVPVALSRLIMECCETNPEDRPRDMKQLLSRLEVIEHVISRRSPETTQGN
jgi:serine/threonine-protein kinase